MNEFLSANDTIYRDRLIGPHVSSAVKSFPVVVITGARQVGKSTFLQHEFPDFKYVNLDDFSMLEQARRDPLSLWSGVERVVIDEAQKAPDILSAVKLTVDKAKGRNQFLISGSSNLLLMKKVSETLAGRAVYFDMLPMSYQEMEGRTKGLGNFASLWAGDSKVREKETDAIDPVPLILRGFMPPLMGLTERRDVLLWWEGYVRTYLERDIRELSQIESLIDFKRVLDCLALRAGSVLNQADVSRITGVSQPTVFRYIKLLEVSNVVHRVPGYYQSRGKRLVKSPKLFFIDPGLCTYLSGYHDEESARNAREIGGFFESLTFLHIKILSELMVPKVKIYYWRTTTGKEVDFVLEHGRKLVAVEVKLTKNPAFGDIGNLLTFIDDYPQAHLGLLLHAGRSIRYLHSKVLAVPWWWMGE
jgi:uncharacterized protein